MILVAEQLISEFAQIAARRGLQLSVEHEVQRAPHRPHGLPVGKCAVYAFSLSEEAGRTCRAGAHHVLKVGRVGPNSSPRFLSQHYNPNSAGSNLARTILRSRHLWPYLGIDEVTEDTVGSWIKRSTDRDHFYLEAAQQGVLADFERFVRGHLGPVFEG